MASNKIELELGEEIKRPTFRVQETAKVEFNDTVKEWTIKSKIHGLDRLIISHNLILKVIWFFFLVALTGVAVYLVSKTLLEYLRFEVKSRIREVYEQQVQFPTVAICNSNPFATPVAIDYIRQYLEKKFNVSVNNYDDLNKLMNKSVIPTDEVNYLYYLISNPNFNQTLLKSFGYDLLSCQFNSNDCVMNEDIFWYFNSLDGYCFKFNPATYNNGTKRAIYHTSVPYSGLTIELFVGNPNDEKNYLYNYYSKGFSIRVDEPDIFAITSTDAYIKPGTDSLVLISQKKTETQPMPYSDCIPNDSIDTLLANQMRKLQIKYTHLNCLLSCEQKIIMEKYDCQYSGLPILSENHPLCNNRSVFESITILESNLTVCSDWCPIECSASNYDVKATSLEYPSYSRYRDMINYDYDRYVKLFGTTNITYEMFKASVSSVTVTFKQIKYTEIVEMPIMTAVDLISSIGGSMGLFIGFSFMICVEFIELAVSALIILIKNQRKC